MVSPAQGEGAAIGGYHYQYRASAAIVLAALMDGSLRWIRLKDEKAGRVDDFIIGRNNRIDGYQFKHRSNRAFTFRNLTTEENETGSQTANATPRSTSLIRQLAEGWLALKGVGGPRIVVHLATNARSSISDTVPVDDGTTGPKDFTEFLSEAWEPARATGLNGAAAFSAKWRLAWTALRAASGLDESQFDAFARDCELDFQFTPESVLQNAAHADPAVQGDLDAIRRLLFDAAALQPAPVDWSVHQLLDRLGWAHRFRPSNAHVFPIDDALYQPIHASVSDLEDKLAALSGGYVGVFGSPGSGKSTLLTQAMRSRSDRVVRYYAYVPDPRILGMRRGESENFLHDVVLALHEEGFSGGGATIGFDRLTLLDRLRAQLELLHENWVETGIRTLLLIDGLDHVGRDVAPARSFLEDLPHPTLVPDGVIILVGSQTDTVLPLPVRHAVRSLARRVEMQPLDREEIFGIIDKASIRPELSDTQHEQVAELSAGHPLALVYVLNAVKIGSGTNAAQRVLDETPLFTGEIDARYRSAWAQIEADFNAVNILGYASRMRGPIDLRWLELRVGFEAAYAVRARLGHFFRHEDGARWYFFHDSFRRFLLDRTGETWPEHPDPARDAQLHSQLADWLANESQDSGRAWDELYHRARAGQDERVVALVTQSYFRRQALALRPIDAIREDLGIALPSVARRRDPVALARLVLAGTELGQREWHIDLGQLVQILIGLDEPLVAVEHLRHDWRLRTSRQTALQASRWLDDAGLATEAARLFDLAEPLDQFRSGRMIDVYLHDDDWKILTTWAEIAPRYRSVDQLLQIVRGLSFSTRETLNENPEEHSRRCRNQLTFRIGLGLIRDEHWDDLDKATKALDQRPGDVEPHWWLWLHVNAWRSAARSGFRKIARTFLDSVLDHTNPASLGPDDRVVVAEAIYRLANDELLARSWLNDVPQPTLDPTEFGLDAGFQPFDPRFRMNRLRSAMGDPIDPIALVPESASHPRPGTTRFERFVCVTGQIAGLAWRGDTIPPARIRTLIRPGLGLFDRRIDYRSDDTWWYRAQRARSGLVRRLIEAIAGHGEAAITALREELEESWRTVQWANDDRRAAILALAEQGLPQTWAIVALQQLEPDSSATGLTIDRIDECVHQVEAWLGVNDLVRARATLTRLLTESNAIAFRKDDQLAGWIGNWLADANAADPDGAAERVRWFARTTLALAAITEDGADQSAAEALLGAAFRWSPRHAVRLLSWYLDQRFVRLEEAISQFLQAALDSPSPPIDFIWSLVLEVVVPIAFEGPSRSLLTKLFAMEFNLNGRTAAEAAIKRLAVRAATLALPASRQYWRRWMSDALEPLGLDPETVGLNLLPPELPIDFAPRTTVPTATTDAEADDDPGRTQGHLDADESRPFDWHDLVKRVAAGEPIKDIDNLASLFREKSLDARIMNRLGEALLVRGNPQLAYEAFESVLSGDHTLAWERRWGGGEKIDAARRLIEIDAAHAIPLLYKCLASDLTNKSMHFGAIASSLREIESLLADPVPIGELCVEVEEFVAALFAAHELPDVNLPWLSDCPEQDDPENGLADLVAMLLRYPVDAVVQSARRVCALCILRGEAAVGRIIEDGFRGSSDLQTTVLEVLDAVALKDKQKVEPFHSSLSALASSLDFSVRTMARELCDRLALAVNTPPHISRPLVHDITLPTGMASDIRPFEGLIAIIAQTAGVSAESMVWRVATIMREIADPEAWSPKAEQKLGELIHSSWVHLPYRRPRVTAARCAIFRVVSELVDSGDLDDADVARLAPMLRIHDPAMMLAVPSIRPDAVAQMDAPGYGHNDEDAWITRVHDACAARAEVRAILPDTVLLAERTIFRQVDQKDATEERRMVLGRWGELSQIGGPVRFANVDARPLSAYAEVLVKTRPTPLVIENVTYNAYDTPSPWWLALNPEIARTFGWRLDTDVAVLPRWTDSDGRPTVWTTWWCDGILHTSWAAPTCVVGEGWLVTASQSAAVMLRERFGAMTYRLSLQRSLAPGNSAPKQHGECSQIVPF